MSVSMGEGRGTTAVRAAKVHRHIIHRGHPHIRTAFAPVAYLQQLHLNQDEAHKLACQECLDGAALDLCLIGLGDGLELRRAADALPAPANAFGHREPFALLLRKVGKHRVQARLRVLERGRIGKPWLPVEQIEDDLAYRREEALLPHAEGNRSCCSAGRHNRWPPRHHRVVHPKAKGNRDDRARDRKSVV